MKLSRELKTGIIVIGGILLFIMGFSYLKSTPIFDNSKTLYAIYPNVGGLQSGTTVSINGFSVGKVNNIKFLDEKGNLLVTFNVSNDFKFSKNSIVELYDTGIIGGKGLQIRPVFDATGLAQSGDTLRTETRPGITDLAQQKLTPLVRKFESAISGADSVLVNVNSVLDTNTKKELKEVIVGLNDLIVSLNGSAASLNTILVDNKDKLNNSFKNFDVLTSNFAKLSDSINAAGLGRTLARLESTMTSLDNVAQKIENGDGTLGLLMTDKELYTNLNSTTKELDLLLQDLRLNPKRYVNVSVFGKKQKDYTVPEDDPAEKIEE
ncbi:MlaD family protein [Maribacter sp. ACAM166]|uniref:MlaD family protein n=1 Tax=Maribacter sp. ACAM166 TaxID=2508996 RepID=UPI0010FE7342|nr:MlaD family protein [Maribacter sp. ACAM166]TLP80539.1 MCE family protein [Maribacter sp. ACAM166]